MLLVALSPCVAALAGGNDPRTFYDVQAYALELKVDPEKKRIRGTCRVEARVVAPELEVVQLDLDPHLEPERATLEESADGRTGKAQIDRDGARINCRLPTKLARGATFALAVEYSGAPDSQSDFDGFHWRKTQSGEPWIATSSQGTGSKHWWPSKDSFFHPEDKPERFEMRATVPAGLYAVSNGRLVERKQAGDWETFHWRHEYPLETYSVTLDVAPYVVVERQLTLAGCDEPVPFVYYVLPEAQDKAAVQFAGVPEMVAIFADAFGSYPFPKSKLAFVHVPFWGMEHSTAVAYGSSFPAWIAQERARDPSSALKDKYGFRNADYDYILVHEFAHEWWGNAVSAADWADFWIHEGFATYAEGVYVERAQGREAADTWWKKQRPRVEKKGSLFRGKGSDSDQAYGGIIYSKGAWVLHTLRTYVDDDQAWWKLLREFNLAYRYKNASTDDFRATVEKATGREWNQFFDEWFLGQGYPELDGQVAVESSGLRVKIACRGTAGTEFHVPLDLAWVEGDEPRTKRVMLSPGDNELTIATERAPRDVRVPSLDRVLCKPEVSVIAAR
jgi:aminopeptidase N